MKTLCFICFHYRFAEQASRVIEKPCELIRGSFEIIHGFYRLITAVVIENTWNSYSHKQTHKKPPSIPALDNTVLPACSPTSWNFHKLPLLQFLLSHTFPNAFVFLILALCYCALSTVRAISQSFSTYFALILRFVRFLRFSHFHMCFNSRTISRKVWKTCFGGTREPRETSR